MLADSHCAASQHEFSDRLFMSDNDVFDTQEASKKNKDVNTETFKDRVRFPVTMFVDEIEFEPEASLSVITRSSYDLLLTEDDVLKLYMYLSNRIKHRLFRDTRIRFTGRMQDDK